MPALTSEQIKAYIAKFLPQSLQDNPFINSLLAGAASIAILVSTPAFAPVGVVGATGWVIVYIVTGGTFSIELFRKAWRKWKEMSEADRASVEKELGRLKKLHDDGALTDDEYRSRVQAVLDRHIQ